jgi:LPS-assembly protein
MGSGRSLRPKALHAAIVAALLSLAFFGVASAQELADLSPYSDPKVTEEAETFVPFLDRFLKGDEPVIMEADNVRYVGRTMTYEATGQVVVQQGDIKLSADSIAMDLKSGGAYAEGAVTLENAEGKVTCDSIHLSLDQRIGVIVRGRLVVHQGEHSYFITGERIEKIGPNRYLIENGTYTTCDCEIGEDTDWIIEAEEIDLTLDGYAVVRQGRLYTFGNPVAWLPYGIFPAQIRRQTGFLPPRFGWANDDGYRTGIPFFWAIDDHVDATLYSDWYENRGVKEGIEYRYALSNRWKGQFDLDYMMNDRLYEDERWAMSYEHNQNVWKRLYLRSKVNLVSDNEYVVDFPSDISARYDRFLRSNVIANNLWQDFDLNVDFEHYDDLSRDDNSYTWQKTPEVKFNGALFPLLGPLSYRLDVSATKFYREKVDPFERNLDEAKGYERPFHYVSDGHRAVVTPELLAPLSFRRYAYLTPFLGGEGTFYQLNDRSEEKTPSRYLYFTGADLHTESERVFPTHLPRLRGFKHAIQPGVQYLYFPDAHPQDKLPIFDGLDRRRTRNVFTTYLDNRLWMKMFNSRQRRFSTLKAIDLRLAGDFDLEEASRDLDPNDSDDERRPLSAFRTELETKASAGSWLNAIVFRSESDYNLYDEQFDRFSVQGLLGTVNDDALGVEYRYLVSENPVDPDVDFISGLFQYTMLDFITFGASASYSFVDEYFIERIYSATFHSLQNCWSFQVAVEQRELPEKEIATHLLLDLTGLVGASTAF